jgi:hypothetical protein
MGIMHNFRGKPLGLAVAVFFIPQLILAASPTSQVTDVVLQVNGAMIGRLVDSHGTPVGGRDVSLRQAQGLLATARTDETGHFVIRGLDGGSYLLESGASRGVVRVWTATTAPPSAQQAAVLVTDNRTVVRGQENNRPKHLVMLTVAGIAAGGIVAIAVDNDAS